MFVKYPSIESFSHTVKYAHKFGVGDVVYSGKIKLHGTNGGIRVTKDTVVAQSRGRDLFIDLDNAGFALWVESSKSKWQEAFAPFDGFYESVTFFGEWAGKGIQQSDAVTKLDSKYFFVFAIIADNDVFVDSYTIQSLTPDLFDVLVLPNLVEPFVLPFSNTAAVNTIVEGINKLVLEVGEQDPFIHEIFGVSGIGEGVVYTPYSTTPIDRDTYSALTFKAKSEAHRVNKSKDAAKSVMEIPASVDEFVTKFVTEPRLRQAVSEIGGDIDKTRIGEFLKWVQQDIIKEGATELSEMGVDWKVVSGRVSKAAVAWFNENF